jgi:hypothetical protein
MENTKGPITNEAANSDLLDQAIEDITAFRQVMNPDLQEKFDMITDKLDQAESSIMMRTLILAIAFGRRLEKEEKPALILPPRFNFDD